jgi:hypothetical protein
MVGACLGDGGGTPSLDRGSCDVLIECASSLAPEAHDEYQQVYGAGGTCWLNGPNTWAACRDFCRSSLEALNLAGQVTGDTCGACSVNADCGAFGLGATCVAGLCTGGGGGSGEGGSSEGDATTSDPTADTSDPTADTDECFPVPPECEDMLTCLGAVLPDADTSEYEPGGACWCGTSQEAQDCADECVSQLAAAAEAYPDVEACVGDIDPCPDGTEGCECDWVGQCNGGDLLFCYDGTCLPPQFDECHPADPHCPANGCPDGVVTNDADNDGQDDFATCWFECDNNDYNCEYIEGESSYSTCVEISNGSTCMNYCEFSDDCPSGSVCWLGYCWYDVP